MNLARPILGSIGKPFALIGDACRKSPATSWIPIVAKFIVAPLALPLIMLATEDPGAFTGFGDWITSSYAWLNAAVGAGASAGFSLLADYSRSEPPAELPTIQLPGAPVAPGVPQAGIPQGGIPQGGIPQAGIPQGGIPQAGVPQAGIPQAGIPQAGVPQAGIPQGGIPQAGIPQAGVPQAGIPQAGIPQAGIPQAGIPQAGIPQAGIPQGGIPQAGIPQAAPPAVPGSYGPGVPLAPGGAQVAPAVPGGTPVAQQPLAPNQQGRTPSMRPGMPPEPPEAQAPQPQAAPQVQARQAQLPPPSGSRGPAAARHVSTQGDGSLPPEVSGESSVAAGVLDVPLASPSLMDDFDIPLPPAQQPAQAPPQQPAQSPSRSVIAAVGGLGGIQRERAQDAIIQDELGQHGHGASIGAAVQQAAEGVGSQETTLPPLESAADPAVPGVPAWVGDDFHFEDFGESESGGPAPWEGIPQQAPAAGAQVDMGFSDVAAAGSALAYVLSQLDEIQRTRIVGMLKNNDPNVIVELHTVAQHIAGINQAMEEIQRRQQG